MWKISYLYQKQHRVGTMPLYYINKCLQKIWCSIIRGCGAINIISRNKDETLRIVPQCGTI